MLQLFRIAQQFKAHLLEFGGLYYITFYDIFRVNYLWCFTMFTSLSLGINELPCSSIFQF